jgi:hypothetical protein
LIVGTYEPPTTGELKAAFGRACLLRFNGWTFARAVADPLVGWALRRSAMAHRQRHHLPAQPRLI